MPATAMSMARLVATRRVPSRIGGSDSKGRPSTVNVLALGPTASNRRGRCRRGCGDRAACGRPPGRAGATRSRRRQSRDPRASPHRVAAMLNPPDDRDAGHVDGQPRHVDESHRPQAVLRMREDLAGDQLPDVSGADDQRALLVARKPDGAPRVRGRAPRPLRRRRRACRPSRPEGRRPDAPSSQHAAHVPRNATIRLWTIPTRSSVVGWSIATSSRAYRRWSAKRATTSAVMPA